MCVLAGVSKDANHMSNKLLSTEQVGSISGQKYDGEGGFSTAAIAGNLKNPPRIVALALFTHARRDPGR